MAKPDWEAIESAYRAGLLSLREIAAQHGISDTAIRKRAKKDGWTRDLAAKIQSKADDLVRRREVRTQVRTETSITERELIEATAETIARVRMEHRGDITRARRLANMLIDELEIGTSSVADFEKLGELMHSPDDKGQDKLNEIDHKGISLPSRVKSVKELIESLKNLVGLERQAYNIDDGKEPVPVRSESNSTDLTTDQAAELYRKMMG